MMNAISNELGAEFFLFLQPSMGISDAQTPKDKNSKNYELYLMKDDVYYQEIKKHYKQLKDYCEKLNFCYDISDIATPEKEIYNDVRHHNAIGNKIISDEIYQIIFGK